MSRAEAGGAGAIGAGRELPLSARVPSGVPSVGAGPHAWLLLIGGPVDGLLYSAHPPSGQSRGTTSRGDKRGAPTGEVTWSLGPDPCRIDKLVGQAYDS